MSFKENSIAVSPFGSPSNGQSILVSMAVSTCERMLSVGFIPCLCSALIVTVVVTKALIREEGFKCRNKSIRFSLDCGWDVEGSGVVQCGVLFSLVTQLCWSWSVCLSDWSVLCYPDSFDLYLYLGFSHQSPYLSYSNSHFIVEIQVKYFSTWELWGLRSQNHITYYVKC